MRNKLFITHGTLGLVLAGSVFIGCQDFLGSDKGNQPAAPSGDNLQHAAQALSAQDSAKDLPAQAAAGTPGTAQELPANAPGNTSPEGGAPSSQPAATEPEKSAPPPAATALTPEQQACLDAYNVLQSGKGDAYAQAKDMYVGNNCDQVLGAAKPDPRPTYTPPDTAQLCEMYRKNAVTLPTTGDPKYDAYMAQQAIMCAGYP
ncbi:MAG: hypothetical protein JF616_09670 [Fibrobacteres bacterium]|nr:hypothetical protein [Fibrobacterota bacterium]